MMEKAKIIYPMSMLAEVVGNEEKVRKESERFEFNPKDEFFQYEEGVVLESLDFELAEFAESVLGFVHYAAAV